MRLTFHRLVEFFSPWCHHCQALAPTWQTLYEFYYASKPLQSSTDDSEGLNSFTRYYDFHFAKLDCTAYGTACSSKEVHAFPTIILFKDGEKQKSSVGVKSLSELSKWVEETLEAIRPGSRPAGGPKLPKVGAHEVKDADKPAIPAVKGKDTKPGSEAEKKQSAVASSLSAGLAATSSATPATPTKASKAKVSANPSGVSVELTAEKFQSLVTNTLDPWFVKFYAPWCHHCQALKPNWATMARDMQGVLNIGEVNCDVEKRLCKDARVKGYPTLLFFRGGERVEYSGLRGVGDLISYARKAVDVGQGVTDVDLNAFEKLEEKEEVIFVYFYDHATTSEDFAALDRLTLSLVGHAKLVKTQDPKMAEKFKISTWPRLMVSRDGIPSYYPYLAPKDMRNYRQVLEWMMTVWQPIVPELTASNAREIMDGHYVVLGILSRARSDEFAIAKREIKNAALEWIEKDEHNRQLERQELRDAKQLRIEEAQDRNDERAERAAKQIRIDVDSLNRPKVRFAWVDGAFWDRWLRTTYGIDVSEGEKVIINDEDVSSCSHRVRIVHSHSLSADKLQNHRYWDQTSTGNPIVPSRTSILETIPRVIANPPKIPSKSTASSIAMVWYRFKSAWQHHPILCAIGTTIAVLSLLILGRRYRRVLPFGGQRYGSAGFFNLGDEKGVFGGFGGASGEKSD